MTYTVMLQLSKNDGTYLYRQVLDLIVENIDSGTLRPGDRLPSERKLAEQLQVSRTSVREALGRLETIGLLESRHGLGTFVKDPSRELLQA